MALPSQVDTAVPFLLLDDTCLSSPYRFYTLAILFRKESADPSCDGVNSEPPAPCGRTAGPAWEAGPGMATRLA